MTRLETVFAMIKDSSEEGEGNDHEDLNKW